MMPTAVTERPPETQGNFVFRSLRYRAEEIGTGQADGRRGNLSKTEVMTCVTN